MNPLKPTRLGTRLIQPTRVTNTTSQHWKKIPTALPEHRGRLAAKAQTAGLRGSAKISTKTSATQVVKSAEDRSISGAVVGGSLGGIAGAFAFRKHLWKKIGQRLAKKEHLIAKKVQQAVDNFNAGKGTRQQVFESLRKPSSFERENKYYNRAMKQHGRAHDLTVVGGVGAGGLAGYMLGREKKAGVFHDAFGGGIRDFATKNMGLEEGSREYSDFLSMNKKEQARLIDNIHKHKPQLDLMNENPAIPGKKWVRKTKAWVTGGKYIDPAKPLKDINPQVSDLMRLHKTKTRARLLLGGLTLGGLQLAKSFKSNNRGEYYEDHE